MGRWSPLFCCCLFYNARTGTKILLHLEIVCFIVTGIALFILDFLAGEFKNFFKTHRNIHYESYQHYRTDIFTTFILISIIMFFAVTTGVIALQIRKPILLIPYLIYSIFKAVGMIPVVEKFYSRKDDIIATLNDIATGYDSASRGFGFVNPENPDQDQVTVDLIKYAVYAILSLLVALMISEFHFAQVICECLCGMIKESRRKQKSKDSQKVEIESNNLI